MLRIDRLAPPYPVPEGIGLGEFERRIMAEDVEVVGVFGADGRLVLAPKSGGSDAVSFVPAEADFLRGAVVTHNHPSESVLSPDDALLAAEYDVRELRAVVTGGTVYSLVRPESGWPDAEDMVAAIERAWREIPQENASRRSRGQPILKGKDRHDWMFRDQRNALHRLGVRLSRSDVWQR